MKERPINQKLAIGVDVGGSHVSCAAFDLKENKYLKNTFSENELDNHAQADIIIETIGKTLNKSLVLAGPEKVEGIGFAMPGPFDYVNGISRFKGENGKFENTYGLNMPEGLLKYLGLPETFKVRFINDATAFAIGEDRFGKAEGYSTSISITLGTGFGSAFIKGNMPILLGDTVPGQGCVWHLPFEDGIADDYFSTRGFVNRYYQRTGAHIRGVKELAALADREAIARGLFDDFGLKLGGFLQPWIKSSGSEILVIGGNISKAYPLFKEGLDQGLGKVNVAVEVSDLKESASMIGSAFLIDDNFYSKLLPLLSVM
ncbi:MAG: ROK family protein [Bacteroidota bacterium]